jgi:membrane protease YdiL (CAAX protease family)
VNTSTETIPPPLPGPASVNRARWAIHLVLLALYPLALGLIPLLVSKGPRETLLPNTSGALLIGIGFELGIFGAVFGIAWLASRANPDQLFLRWRGGVMPVLWGLVYSICLRLGVAIILGVSVLVLTLSGVVDAEALQSLRPQTEAVVDISALLENPLYLLLNLTLVSFVMAGLREELWRAGVIAALLVLMPKQFRGWLGGIVAVLIAAGLFGLGHLPQGWGGVALTTLLGLGLGAIMLRHRSVWEPVLAHGFFDATTFALLAFLARYYPDLISNVLSK